MMSRLMEQAKAAPVAILSLQIHIKERLSSSSLPIAVFEDAVEEEEEEVEELLEIRCHALTRNADERTSSATRHQATVTT